MDPVMKQSTFQGVLINALLPDGREGEFELDASETWEETIEAMRTHFNINLDGYQLIIRSPGQDFVPVLQNLVRSNHHELVIPSSLVFIGLQQLTADDQDDQAPGPGQAQNDQIAQQAAPDEPQNPQVAQQAQGDIFGLSFKNNEVQ